jgi:hypothetical protein
MSYFGCGRLRLTSGLPEASLRRNLPASRTRAVCHGAAPFTSVRLASPKTQKART